jgi:hypothetical protein
MFKFLFASEAIKYVNIVYLHPVAHRYIKYVNFMTHDAAIHTVCRAHRGTQNGLHDRSLSIP